MPFLASNPLTGAVEIVEQGSQVLAQLAVSFYARRELRQPRVLTHPLGRDCRVTRSGPNVGAQLLVTSTSSVYEAAFLSISCTALSGSFERPTSACLLKNGRLTSSVPMTTGVGNVSGSKSLVAWRPARLLFARDTPVRHFTPTGDSARGMFADISLMSRRVALAVLVVALLLGTMLLGFSAQNEYCLPGRSESATATVT